MILPDRLKKAVKSTALVFGYCFCLDCGLVRTKATQPKLYNFHYIKIVIFYELTKYFELFSQKIKLKRPANRSQIAANL